MTQEKKTITSVQRSQEYLDVMKSLGYPFSPIVRLSKRKKEKNIETEDQYNDRINAVSRDVLRLAHVSLVYDEVFEKIQQSTGDQKQRWLVVEDLLNNESVRIRKKLGIRARDNKTAQGGQ